MHKEDWDQAAKVKSGEVEWPGFDTLKVWIQRTPKTMLPAILIQVVTCCLAEKVFREGGLLRIVQKCLDDWNKPGHGILRED